MMQDSFYTNLIASTDRQLPDSNLHKYLNEEVIGKKISPGILRGGRKQMITLIPGKLK